MRRGFFACLAATLAVLLSSCGSSGSKEEFNLIPEGAREVNLESSSKFDWRKDVKTGKDGTIMGGKRSQYDRAVSAGYDQRYDTPEYLKKNFHQQAWMGDKNFSAGSYQGLKSAQEAGGKSRFDRASAKVSKQRAKAEGQSYETGSYATQGARETQKKAVAGGESPAVAHRQKVWGWEQEIYSKDEYRRMTVRETRSLLGRD